MFRVRDEAADATVRDHNSQDFEGRIDSLFPLR
jgi:hypothetical protein